MKTVVYVQDVYNITGIGAILVGTIKSGSLKLGMKLNINGKIMPLKTIEMNHKQIQEAHEGDAVGLSLLDGDYTLLKSISKQDVFFSEDGSIITRVIEKPKPLSPVGFLDSFLKLFRKN